MDKIIVVKLEKLDVEEFCNRCESFNCDIDLIDGSNTLDAKDVEHILLMAFDRNFCISINSKDEQEILRFNKIMDKYIVD